MKIEDLIEPQLKEFEHPWYVDRPNPAFIPVYLGGGIGDLIINHDAIRRFNKDYRCIFYSNHTEAFKYFHGNSIPIFKEIPDYTWRLSFNTVAKFQFTDSFHGFLLKEHEELYLKQDDLFKKDPRLQKLVKSHHEKFFLLAHYAKEMKWWRYIFPLKTLGYEDAGIDHQNLEKKETKDYITVHDGFDVNNQSLVKGRCTKQWHPNHWKKLIQKIKKEYPKYRIIQLGAVTSNPIEGVDECLINKTTITEAFDILSHSRLHIDGDSGLVHAATRMQVRCLVIWGPTEPRFYSYWENINLRSKVCGSACYGVNEHSWMDKCPIGYKTPKCMDATNPEEVFDRIHHLFQSEIP